MLYEISPLPTDSIATLGLRFRLVDVREDDECREPPIVSDYHIPFSQFDITQLRLSKDTKILVVCAHGQRSLTITNLLREKGWSNTFSLNGGLSNLFETVPTDVFSENSRAA